MKCRFYVLLVACAALLGCATVPPDAAAARQAVMDTERAFAKTMADRNPTAFADFISDEAVFFSGPKPLHGKQQVVDGWARYFVKPMAPFSWEPDEVEVLASGNLALSSGPVRNADGKTIARFTSVWRRTPRQTWEIIFDKGSDVCDCNAP